jgi:hypothetical protein
MYSDINSRYLLKKIIYPGNQKEIIISVSERSTELLSKHSMFVIYEMKKL